MKQLYYSLVKNYLKKPIYLIYFITNKCNAKCGHCFYSQNLNLLDKKDLTLQEVEDFSKEIGKLVWLDFSGGEPFLRHDIDKLYEIFLRNNKIEIFSCPTNSISTDIIIKKTRKMLELGKVKQFNVGLSLDGLEKTHNKFRGVKCFDKVLKTYHELAKMKKEFPQLSLKVSTTLSNQNINQIEALHKFVKKEMPEVDFHNFEILRGVPKNSEFKSPSMDDLRNLQPLIFKIWGSYDLFGKSIKSRITMNAKKILYGEYMKILQTNKQPFRCYAGNVHAVLDNNGDISMCELLGKIGNVREQTFLSIWHSDKARKMRKFIKNRKCSCTHSCFQNTNLIFNQAKWLSLLRGKK